VTTNHALVTGGHGLVGRYVAAHLAADPRWRVTTTSRRPEPVLDGSPHVDIDLADPVAVASAHLPAETTHLFFAAYQGVADPVGEVHTNLAMLEHTLDALRRAGAALRHVTLYQGSKAYGAHLGAFRTPARESDPRHFGPLFYYAQEDALRQRAEHEELHFTVLRPDHVCGVAFGAYINLLHVIALYATITRELGQPLRFPGTDRAYRSLVQLTDARLLARASAWAATAPEANDEIFNVTNGDQIRWCHLWPGIADYFGLEVGEPTPYRLVDVMADKAPLWEAVVLRHDLQKVPFEAMTSWTWANAILGVEHDLVSSTVKIRQAGFGDCLDSEASLLGLFDEMRQQRLLPPI
jgi:nucleoside-diphosphate-sugar epimerase